MTQRTRSRVAVLTSAAFAVICLMAARGCKEEVKNPVPTAAANASKAAENSSPPALGDHAIAVPAPTVQSRPTLKSAKTLDQEAEAVAWDFFELHWTKHGESFVAKESSSPTFDFNGTKPWVDLGYVELKGVTIQLRPSDEPMTADEEMSAAMNGRDSIPGSKPLTEADRLNGWQWKGSLALHFTAMREYRTRADSIPLKDQNKWSEWKPHPRDAQRSNRPQAWDIFVAKRNGSWSQMERDEFLGANRHNPLGGASHKFDQVDAREMSEVRMREIAQALVKYADLNKDQLPEAGCDWKGRLISAGLAKEEVFHAPDERSGQLSYFYVPGPNSYSSDQVMLLENPWLRDPPVVNVVFAECHSEVVTIEKYWAIVDSQKLLPGVSIPFPRQRP
jgi:hypothetical protein